jgi:putative phosphoribosyl transferase
MELPMTIKNYKNIIEQPELREKVDVFRDRQHAGEVLADLLKDDLDGEALILGIPAGGIPVAVSLARILSLPLDALVVSKITFPWDTEAGYGAVAWDGTVLLNDALVAGTGLSEQVVQEGMDDALKKVERRNRLLRGSRPLPQLKHRTVILVDDGLASGFTMMAAVAALRKTEADPIIVVIPTGHGDAVRKLANLVNTMYCPNIREGRFFAVADAYEHWTDVEEQEMIALLKEFQFPENSQGKKNKIE